MAVGKMKKWAKAAVRGAMRAGSVLFWVFFLVSNPLGWVVIILYVIAFVVYVLDCLWEWATSEDTE